MRSLLLIVSFAIVGYLNAQNTVTEVVDVQVIEHREDSTDYSEPVFVTPMQPGAIRDMYRFIGELLVYPEEALAERVEGKVFVQFIVEADGSLSDLEVLRGIGSGCDEEALRIVGLLPKWRPGTKDGVPTAMEYRMPVKFKIKD